MEQNSEWHPFAISTLRLNNGGKNPKIAYRAGSTRPRLPQIRLPNGQLRAVDLTRERIEWILEDPYRGKSFMSLEFGAMMAASKKANLYTFRPMTQPLQLPPLLLSSPTAPTSSTSTTSRATNTI